jgi:hypothetical protein
VNRVQRHRIGVVGLLAVLIVAVATSAQAGGRPSADRPFTATFRVIGATHSSSVRKDDPPFYNGTSSASWKLAPPTKKAPNTFSVTSIGAVVYGLGMVNVSGVFTAEATTNRPAHCTLTAATGSTKYPGVAPGAFPLALGPDPKSPNRVLFGQGPGFNVHASVSNPYFGSECSTSTTGEPSTDELFLKAVSRNAFRQKLVVIRYGGSTNRNGISYRWSTVFTLKQISLKFS